MRKKTAKKSFIQRVSPDLLFVAIVKVHKVEMGCAKHTGCPRRNATDMKNCNRKCFILIIKRLFSLKSAIIRINVVNFPVFLGTWL